MKTRTLWNTVLLASAFAVSAIVLPTGGKPAIAQTVASGTTTRIFLKLDGVTGGAVAKGFEKQIDINSLSFGVSHSAGGKPIPREMSLAKSLDPSSALLFTKSASGDTFKTGTITVVGPNGAAQVIYTLSNVEITSLQTAFAAGSPGTEQLSLFYSKVEIQVKSTSPDGRVGTPFTGGYDFAAGKAL